MISTLVAKAKITQEQNFLSEPFGERIDF